MQKERVLAWIADTEQRIRLVNVINRSGKYQAVEYRNAGGELEGLYMQRPQYILLDVDYAVTEPEPIVSALRKNIKGVRIIGLSFRWDEFKRKQLADLFDTVLVMPFDLDSFERAAEDAQSQSSNSKCEVMAFFAPKGKSGRTTLIVNLAMSLARASGEKVCIIDAETNFADMDTFLNLAPQSTIVEALRDLPYLTPNTFTKYCESVNNDVSVLCGAKSLQNAAYVTAEGLTKLIQLARKCYRFVLIDLAPGFNPVTIAACEASEHVFVTTMANDAFEMTHLKKTLEIFHSLENWENRVEVVISRMKPDVHKRSALGEELGCPVNMLPNEYLLCSQAANNGRMALDIGPNSTLTQQIDLMTVAILRNK